MYKNLKAEMIRQNICIAKIAETIDKKPDTVVRKINGQMRLTIEESKKIAKLFPENNSLEYLFRKN